MGMTIDEIIENYKLRIPPDVYYDLRADIREALDRHDEEVIRQTVHSIWAKDTILQMAAMLTAIKAEMRKMCWKDAQGQIVKEDRRNKGILQCAGLIQLKIDMLKDK